MGKKIVGRFLTFPAELCRAQNGAVCLREWKPSKPSYDVTISSNGMVSGAVMKGSSWPGPNGMSMRTPENSIQLVTSYKGRAPRIYKIPKNTPVPDGLVLLLDNDQHYSLQPLNEMSKTDLDTRLQTFLDGLHFEPKTAWLERVVGGAPSSIAGSSSSSRTSKPSSSSSTSKPSSSSSSKSLNSRK